MPTISGAAVVALLSVLTLTQARSIPLFATPLFAALLTGAVVAQDLKAESVPVDVYSTSAMVIPVLLIALVFPPALSRASNPSIRLLVRVTVVILVFGEASALIAFGAHDPSSRTHLPLVAAALAAALVAVLVVAFSPSDGTPPEQERS